MTSRRNTTSEIKTSCTPKNEYEINKSNNRKKKISHIIIQQKWQRKKRLKEP